MMRPVILSRPEKLAFLLTIFCAGGSLSTAWRHHGALVGLRRRYRNTRRGILGDDGSAGRRRQGLRLHASRRWNALPRQRTVGRGQQPALRQFRHFLLVVGQLLLLIATGNVAGRARRGIGKDIADLRARRRRKRDRGGG